MKKIKKIVLGSTGFFGQENIDLYLDVNLNRNFNEVRPETYENDFDIKKQFDRERNESRDFVLYGLIDSIVDPELLKINTQDKINENLTKIEKFNQEIANNNSIISINNTTISSVENGIVIDASIIIERDRNNGDLDFFEASELKTDFNSITEIETLLSFTSFEISTGSGILGQYNIQQRSTLQKIKDDIAINYNINGIETIKSTNDLLVEKNTFAQEQIPPLEQEIIILQNFIDSVGEDIDYLQLWNEHSRPTDLTITEPQILEYSSKNEILLNNGAILRYIKNIPTTTVSYDTGNVFGVHRRKYYTELNAYSSTTQQAIYLFIDGELLTVNSDDYVVESSLFKQQLVFVNSEGTFIPYGNDTQEIEINGTITEVQNDYPFFYNKHWIKKNLDITRSFIPTVSFLTDTLTIREADEISIPVILNKAPSSNGSTVVFVTQNTTASPDDYVLSPSPLRLNFNGATTSLDLILSAKTDSTIEVSERFSIVMNNFISSLPGPITKMDVIIMGSEIENSCLYNLQKTFKNQSSFNIYPDVDTFIQQTTGLSQLREGYYLSNNFDPNSFFVNESFEIKITNNGIDTIFPIDNGVIDTDFIFKANESYSLSVNSSFEPTDAQTMTIDINLDPVGTKSAIFDINGTIHINIKTVDDLLNSLSNNSNNKTFSYQIVDIEDADGNVTRRPMVLSSNINGIPIVIRQLNLSITPTEVVIDGSESNGFTVYEYKDPFDIKIKLSSNTQDGLGCNYKFELTKGGYKPIIIDGETIMASSPSNEIFLVTGYENIDIAYNGVDCTDIFTGLQSGTAYANGVLFAYATQNETNVIYSRFVNQKLIPIPCTEQDGLGGFKISLT